jgi:hypothetical protein
VNVRKAPDKRIQRYLEWYSKQLAGLPEDQILRELEKRELGEFGSPEALYHQLANDGFPVCRVCGETPVRPEHCDKQPKKRQPDLGGGRRVRLPDASSARNLFRTALKEFDTYLTFMEGEESWLDGDKHFITHSVDDSEEVVMREGFTHEEWKDVERGTSE